MGVVVAVWLEIQSAYHAGHGPNGGLPLWHADTLFCRGAQALKANPEGAAKELKLNANYITKFGQVALGEAVDMVYEMGKGRMTTIVF